MRLQRKKRAEGERNFFNASNNGLYRKVNLQRDDLSKNGKSGTALLGRKRKINTLTHLGICRGKERRIENPTENGMKRMHGKEAETRMPVSG